MEDPRCNDRNQVDYPLVEIMFLVISAVISGITEWKQISAFGENKLEWMQKFFPSMTTVPAPSTISRLFAQIDSESFGSFFIDWVNELSELTKGEVIAIDGKTMRGSCDPSDNKAAIHMVSAFASSQSLCLGQLATDQKSNEITAIPKLLDLLSIEGCTVTIDAMGCQKEISKKILEKNADYILQVKNNQKGLLEQIEKVFKITKHHSSDRTNDLDHGRIEQRTCTVISDLTHLDDYKDWPGLKSIVRIQSSRTFKNTGKEENSTRYYISSKSTHAKVFNQDIRGHWGIENKLHWSLDVSFNEDKSKKRKDHSPANFGIITKITLNLIAKSKIKNSKKGKMFNALLNDKYREELLGI